MQILYQQSNRLFAGTVFSWRIFGFHLQSTIKEFVPYERLAWDARATGILAYHAWLIIPTATVCTVITEETQHGWLCRPGKLFMPNRMQQIPPVWLQGLKRKAAEI